MSRKAQYSKELKLDTAKRYLNGEGSYLSLAKELGTHRSTIGDWISKYKKYGDDAFNASSCNASYTKEFKEKVVLSYLNGEGTYPQLAIRFNISAHSIIIGWVKRYNSHIELKDYIPGGDVYMTKSRKVSKAERLEIVKYCMEHDLDYKTSAKIYEVNYANVYNWVKKYKEFGEEALGDKRGIHKSDEEVDEVELLKRQLKKYQQQLEIAQLEVRLLKKAEEIERRRFTEQVHTKSNMRQSKKAVKKK